MGNGIAILDAHPIDLEGVKRETVRTANSIHWKREKGTVKIFCTNCQRYATYTSKEWRRIRQAEVCPMCYFHPFRYSNKTEWMFRAYIREGCEGYKTWAMWRFGKEPLFGYKHVYHIEGNREYRRGIVKGMMYTLTEDPKDEWKRCRSWYGGFFYYLEDLPAIDAPITRRQYYEGMGIEGLKSDQATFVKKGVFSEKQIQFIIAFDLHDPEEIYKHSSFVKSRLLPTRHGKWNVHTLDYLDRMNISPIDYADYEAQCEELGFKPDKPKDFKERHEKYAQMVRAKQNAEMDQKILDRIESLVKYQKGNVVIVPFTSCEEMIQCGKKLHNCIGTYTEDYSSGKTDLYHMDVDGKLTAAIEIRNGELIQSRADHNAPIKDKHIRAFTRMVKENYERSTIRTA
jgi:hypothetical protein